MSAGLCRAKDGQLGGAIAERRRGRRTA